MKVCRSCGVEKPLAKFKPGAKGYRRPDCYACVYAKNSVEINRRAKAWSEANKELIRDRNYFRNYGVSIDWYDAQLQRQDGRCAVCGADNPRRANVGYFAVDHNHITGEARALLCHPCNVGIGMLQDDTAILRQAIIYLEDEPNGVSE